MRSPAFSILTLLFLIIAGCKQYRHSADANMDPTHDNVEVTRFGSVIMLKPEKYKQYKELHAEPWPGVDSLLRVYHIRNYSIYHRDGYLFSYLEYTGENWEKDMAMLAEEPLIQEWWKLTDPCQEPLKKADEGEWWAAMEELYHLN